MTVYDCVCIMCECIQSVFFVCFGEGNVAFYATPHPFQLNKISPSLSHVSVWEHGLFTGRHTSVRHRKLRSVLREACIQSYAASIAPSNVTGMHGLVALEESGSFMNFGLITGKLIECMQISV